VCAETCTDGALNNGETDVDCGGANCAGCGDGNICQAGSDCASGICTGGTCQVPACDDGVKNGGEGDVDCGGTCPTQCADGSTCGAPGDCVSGVCTGGLCAAPACDDGIHNGNETDVDCGGGGPCGPCPTGDACGAGSDCMSGVCSGGMCGAPVCGDGILATSEQCDDTNLVDGDCCSATCTLETDCEVEPNGTPAESLASVVFPAEGIIKGRILPAGDVDFLAIDIPVTIDLKIETFEGWSGSTCPAIDTFIELRAPDGTTILASDDDDNPQGSCSLIDPAIALDAGARSLVPGTYYIRVNEYQSNDPIPAYHVKLTIVAECGDGVKQGSEQCDDGDLDPGDGCSPSCKFETTPEVEPNDSCMTSSGPIAATFAPGPLFSGAITPIGDADWFTFTLTGTADVIFETFDANGPGGCVSSDTEIQIFNADCVTPLGAAQDQGGISNCSRLDPAINAQVRHLPAGEYHVRVNESGNNNVIAGYTLQATIVALCGDGVIEGFEECDGGANCDASCDNLAAVCGDGHVDAPESCDDGNVQGGDGCDSACSAVDAGFQCAIFGGPCAPICGDGVMIAPEQCDDTNHINGDGCDSGCGIESGPTAEVEPNGTFAEADARALDATPIVLTGPSTTLAGAITPAADKDIYQVVLPADAVVRFEVFDSTGSLCNGGITSTMVLLNAAQTSLITDATTGISSCSAITARLVAGTYYVRVEETGNNAVISGYRLQMKVYADIGAESEPNNGQSYADPAIGAPDVFIFGGHQINTDVDYYAVNVPPGRSLRAEIIEGGAETCEALSVDSRLTLYTSGSALLANDDDSGRGYCSLIDGTGTSPLHPGAKALPGGTYLLQVRASPLSQTNAMGQFDYRLVVTIR
jgi:cysteine-rich repeat protein